MKYHPREIFRRFNLSACLALWSICMGVNGMDRFVSLKGGHTPPFTNWTDAATNIQDAIDVATAGDVICVTNGIYATGGKIMAGDLTNRVALDKAVMVRSVNGAPETVIQGQWDTMSANGLGAVRCVWLTDGAVLSGFTLRGGATSSEGDIVSLRCGGGAWCASTNAVVANCIITGNSAHMYGGGSAGGTLNNCILTNNLAQYGGGPWGGTLNNCTVTGNSAGEAGGGSSDSTLNNCIVWGNVARLGLGSANYFSCTLRYSCASPLDSNVGNIAMDPQLLADGVHIAATSPCRTNGNVLYTSGTDFDGQTWANPPSMGCDQWHPQPVIVLPPHWLPTTGAGQAMVFQVVVASQEPFDCSWTKDGLTIEDGPRYGGAHTPNLLVRGFGPEDAGAYQVVVSNTFGMATSVLTRVVAHCVDAAATASLAPYTNWVTAATTIQAAIDAASPGAVIVVTNGIYAAGGKVMAGDLTNRVALDKALMVRSVNGAPETVIQGQWDSTKGIGPGAVRCAWLTDGAGLSGFTLRGGATRSAGDLISLQNGGGAWCASTNAVVANCIITGNTANANGGGSYLGTLNNCALTGNSASTGGGSYQGTLNNCTLTANSASTGGGSYQGTLNNCIVWDNIGSSGSNYYSSTLRYTCASPLDTNAGNIATDPQLLSDGGHIAATSPCRTNGNTLYTSGTDIDGQTWANPPSTGCDQWHPQPVITLPPHWLPTAGAGQAIVLQVVVAGQEPFDCSWTKDGLAIEDGPRYGGAHTPNLLVRGFGLEDAGAYQVVVSSAFGIATSVVVRVVVHCVDAAATASLAPYTNWATAATTIQAAIDAASPGAVIVVTNGIYATGGKVMAGDLTNRVALDKAVMVRSVNGAPETVIQGQWDTMSANGPGAVRCAWLADGAVLSGFTLRGGATRSAGDLISLRSGGGAWCASTNAVVANCIITGNTANGNGGGSYLGTLNNCALTGNSVGSASSAGGGSYLGVLNNCTLTGNSAGLAGGGSSQGTLNNCIVWDNIGSSGSNYYSSTLRYTCASPLDTNAGNIATDPQLLSDGVHIAATSPCRTNGSALYTSGTDLDGQTWANPPSIGCDQWHPQPAIILSPRWLPTAGTDQAIVLQVVVAGQEPFDYGWTKDGLTIEDGPRYGGAHTPYLRVQGFGLEDAGAYQVVVSNAFGMATSVLTRALVHCVDVAATASLAPYTNWATAATTIQAAIDAAVPGAVILVTNGIYATGGKVMAGDLTNRVALDKALMVRSVNGAPETVIQGQWDTTNGIGPGAVRCAWLTDGAVLSGFTLRGGATRSAGDLISLRSGGGAWCASTNAVVANCIITGNTANGNGGGSYLGTLNNCALTGNSASTGGGSYLGTLNNCTLTGNSASTGGGSYQGTLNNCTLMGNTAKVYGGGSYKGTLNNCALTGNSAGPVSSSGGGSYLGTLNNCTVTGNWAVSLGGGSCQGTLNNCIVWGNVVSFGESNYFSSTLRYTCASPLDTNVGNIATDPQLLADGVHIAATSPCRTNGNALYTSGTDLDGQTWANPPSMGCDQWHPQPFITLPPWWLPTAGAGQAMVLQIIVAGQEPFDCSWTKDGLTIEDGPRYGGAHTPGLLVQGFGQEDAGAYQVVVSNAFGMATSVVTRVVVHYVDAAATTSLAPYTNWVTAATTIQAAIDAASPGALILVTNGIYATGGKVMAWNLTNRVALDKAVMVRSVNGAPETVIQGQWDTTNGIGPGAVRCAWLTDGAVLSGFTLRAGATRSVGDLISLLSGGGAWCVSTNAVVANCIITGNTAASGRGGGSYRGTLNNCVLTGNSAGSAGGGSSQGTLNNCTMTGNSASTGGGSYQGTVNNCIVWGNVASSANSNYNSSTLRYTCTSPLDTNVGNIATDPQLLADGVHIAASSPCRTNGNALYTSGTDLDGQTWANPPSMGCDQWHPQPVITLPPRWLPMAGAGQAIVLQVVVAGQEPFDNGWTKDGLTIENGPRYGGAHTPYLRVQGFGLEDAGAYQMVVSNAFGIATSMVVRVGVHCVDAAATASLAPYTNWPTAATTIQAAIDAAVPGAVILVTNGIYATGGKVMAGDLTNRVALDKAVMVRSVNGAPETVIQGQWDMMSANGPGAVRCAWLTDGAVLSGFTLRGGATRSAGDYRTLKYGGGAWCASTNALVANCIITGNTAYSSGGGSFLGTLINCTLARNSAGSDGGGSYLGTLNNCTVTINSAGWYGGGSYQCTLNNCIVWNCTAIVAGPNYLSSTLRYSCAWPLAAGDGNLATDPQLVDNAHLAITSPCRSAGSTLYTSGTDIDGEAWANPPSMGCDEVWEAALTGPLSVAIAVPQTKVLVTRTLEFTGLTVGRVARLEWSFGDGPVSTNLGYQASHAWDNTADYPVTLTAYNADYPGGVSTNLMVHVVPLELQVMAAGGTTDNLCRLTLSSQAGVDYVVEYATNLVPPVLWKTLHAWTGLGGVIEVEDTNATSTARFYRLLAQ